MNSGDRIRIGAVFLVTALIASFFSAGVADGLPAPRQLESRPMEIGPWWGSGLASGGGRLVQGGGTVVWSGELLVETVFDVVDTPTGSRELNGTWDHSGSATIDIDSGGSSARIEVGFEGSGDLTGTGREIDGNGTVATRGTLSGPGGVSIPVSTTDPISFRMDVGSLVCDEAYGTWVRSVEMEFRDIGYQTIGFDGFWLAFRQTDETQESIRRLADTFLGPGYDGSASLSPLLDLAAQTIREYNDFVDEFPNWDVGRVMDIMSRAEALLAALRNLSDCDLKLFGADNVELFVNGLTHAMQQLMIGLPGTEGVTSEDVVNMSQAGTRVGAVGAGARDSERAAEAEEALRKASEEILKDNIDPADNRIRVNDDTTRIMANAAAMGWEIEAGGPPESARDIWESTFGEPAPGVEGGGDE